MKDRCVIIGAAPVDDYSTAPAILPEDLVLCADGGLRHCIALEIQPDLVIGDFDSLEDRSLLAGYPCLELPVEKDDTDTMFAVKYGIDSCPERRKGAADRRQAVHDSDNGRNVSS